MSKYHKINGLFKRDLSLKHKPFIMGDYANPIFEYLSENQWEWTEKVDGTNIRVYWDGTNVSFGGRTDKAQIPVPLLAKLESLFPANKFVENNISPGVLYGEGYGEKIQKVGSSYISDGVDFILFDVNIDGLWLKRESVNDIATSLGVSHVPVIGYGTIDEAIEYVKRFPVTELAASDSSLISEGLVIRPSIDLFDRMGGRVITKIKVRDFKDDIR